MGPYGALIMSFFGGSFFVWSSVLVAGWRLPLLLVPAIIFLGFALASIHKIRAADAHAYAPSKHAARIMGYASAFEGVAIPVMALTLANTGHQSQILPGISAIVGLHFLPMARYIPFSPLYVPAATLLVAALVGFWLSQPTGSIVAGFVSAGTLWGASCYGLQRHRT